MEIPSFTSENLRVEKNVLKEAGAHLVQIEARLQEICDDIDSYTENLRHLEEKACTGDPGAKREYGERAPLLTEEIVKLLGEATELVTERNLLLGEE